jgi:hypothetical protein
MTVTFRCIFFAAALSLSSPAIAVGADVILGSQVVAKAGATPVVLWDATPYVEKLVHQNLTHAKMFALIESTALRIAVERAPALVSAQTITVKVVYARIGAISPVYQNASFTDFERLLHVAVNRNQALANAARWSDADPNKPLPPGAVATVTGQLP